MVTKNDMEIVAVRKRRIHPGVYLKSPFSFATLATVFQRDYLCEGTCNVISVTEYQAIFCLPRFPSSLSPIGDLNVSIFGMTNM